MENNMRARLIEKSPTVIDDTSFFEIVLWHLPTRFREARIPSSTDWLSW